MQINLNPYQRWLSVTAGLAVMYALWWYYGGQTWFFDRYTDKLTLGALGVMVLIFLGAYLTLGLGSALMLRKENHQLRELRKENPTLEPGTAFSDVMITFESGARIASSRKMKVDPFKEAIAERLYAPLERLRAVGNSMVLLGLVGTIGGLVIALLPDSIPNNSEEALKAAYKSHGGVALALVTTFAGIVCKLILDTLRSGYESKADAMISSFGLYLEVSLIKLNKIEGSADE